MRIVKKITATISMLACILNLFVAPVFAEDTEGWRKTLTIGEPMYDASATSITISMDITKIAAVSYAIQFMTTADDGAVEAIASIRLSAAGKLLFRENAGWINASEESEPSFIRADFAANQTYNLKMKFTIDSGLIEWYLDDEKLEATCTTSKTGHPCEHIRLMSTEANMNYLDWSLKSVVPDNDTVVVSETYSPDYTSTQGTNNWYFCEYGTEEIRNLTLSSDGTQWKGDEKYPFINISDKKIVPANELAVGFTFVAPKTGMVRLKGNVTLSTASGDATASIYKGRTKLASQVVTFLEPASYYYTVPLKKGESLHFKVDSNGSNSFDWVFWTPTVEYVNMDYVPEETYTFYQKKDGSIKELTYDEISECYFADDGIAFLSDTAIRPSVDYAVGKSYTVQTEGRHRVFGEFGTTDADMTVTVLKNDAVIWEQLLPAGETGVLDVRMLAEVGDNIDVEVCACDVTPRACAINDLYIEYHVSTAFCRASTGAGYSYSTLEAFSLGGLITNPGDTKVEFYSKRFSRKLPMTYDAQNAQWVSGIEGDTGYFTAEAAYPGKHYDSVMEITVPQSGILRIDGAMPVRDVSDGVVSEISLNDEVLWSSRIGGERPVRWDEPFDVSYFLNHAGVVAKVEKGDKLAFSFNQWRLTNKDKVDISNVMLKYISGDVLSKTTKWKLDKSIVVDTQKKTVQRNGVSESLDVIVKTDTTYIAEDDLEKVFGVGFVTAQTPVTINGKAYLPLRNLAESEGQTVVWAAEKLAIVHSGIPVLFGWTELSELAVAYASDSPSEIYGCLDTYESGTTPTVSLTGSNSDIAYNSMGGLKPPLGYTEVAQQSSAVVLEYTGHENESSHTSRIKISDYVDETKVNILGFDAMIPSPCSFTFSLLDQQDAEGMRILVSSEGLIGLSDSSSNDITGAQFEFGKWNAIKLICDMPSKQCHLYLNDKLVQTVNMTDLKCDTLQITNDSAMDGTRVPLYLDSLTIGTLGAFTVQDTLSETALSGMNVTLRDTFEEEDTQDIPLAWTGDNQLRPLGGEVRTVKQSNAARIFSGRAGEETEHIRFDIQNYVGDGSLPVLIEFDVNLFSDEILVFSDRKYWGYGQQAIVSPNGYIAAAYGKWIDNAEQQAAIRKIAARTRSEQTALGIETADFKLNTWHNIKMLYEDGLKKRSLYVDGKLVCVWEKDAAIPLEAFQISILGDADTQIGSALFDIDNLKIAQLNHFVISDFYPENQSGKQMESFVPGETCYVRIAAENHGDYEEGIQLVIAQYDSTNRLINAFLPEKLFVKESGGALDIGYDSGEDTIAFEVLDKTERIMITAWDEISEMKPLIEAVNLFKTQ